jgi:hypothetical protein
MGHSDLVHSALVRRAWVHCAIVSLFVAAGCGRSSSSKSKPGSCPNGEAPTSSEALQELPSDANVVTLRVDPFADSGELSVAWFAPEGKKAGEVLRFAPPATVEGFHWEWKFPGESRLWLAREKKSSAQTSSGVSWSDGCAVKLESIGSESQRVASSSTRAIGFAIDSNSPPTAATWPAVVGLGNGESKALSLVALSPVMPLDPSARMRIEFVAAKPEGFKLISRAESCGPNCLEFPNYLAAMDSPFFATENSANVFDETSQEGVRLAALIQSPAASGGVTAGQMETCRTEFGSALASAGRMFNLLRSKWSTPKVLSDRYDIYLIHRDAAKTYQGLEHSGSTLISIAGDCKSQGYAVSLNKVIAHEMVHAWNVRHLYPKEHGIYSAESYDVGRTAQLYFYEGFTEGFARVGLAELGINTAASRIAEWNQSLGALYSAFDTAAGKPVVLNVADANNAFGQYQTGAAFLLFVAMQIRLQNALDQDGDAKSKDRFWDILSDLQQRADAGKQSSSWDEPPWLRRPWSGLIASPDASGRFGSGYSSADVAAVLTAAAGNIEGTAGDTVAVTRAQFDATLAAFAEKLAVPVVTRVSGGIFFEVPTDASTSSVAWPL